MAVETKEQVAELMDKGLEAKEIAEKLGKTPATIYVHLRNIKLDRGFKVQAKRGRPPKAKVEGETPKTDSKPRARPPTAKANGGEKAAGTNGHVAESRFPAIKAAVEKELKEARSRVAVLEKMYETV
jgi:hypothetical protein